MISVATEAGSDEEVLARAMTTLVPAAAEGILRDVIVAARDPSPSIRMIADAFGCQVVTGDMRAAIAAARGPWILVLPAGTIVEETWWRDALPFIERSERRGSPLDAAALTACLPQRGLAARLREWAIRLRPSRGDGGLLARKEAFSRGTRLRPVRLRARIDWP